MFLREIGKFVIRKDIAKAVVPKFPEFTKEELIYIQSDQALNIKYAMENKQDINLIALGSFKIKDSRKIKLEFQTQYLKEKGITLDKLPKSVKLELKQEAFKSRRSLADRLQTTEPITTIREIIKQKNNTKNNVK